MKKWKLIKRKLKYKSPYFKVYEEDFLYPNGGKGTYYIVERNDAVIFIPFYKKKVWLVRQYRYLFKKYSYELPAGLVNRSETPFLAAKRELKEEVGVTAKKWKKLKVVSLGHGFVRQKAHIYLAEELDFLNQKPSGDEFKISAHCFSIKKAATLLNKGVIDSLQFVAWELFLKYLKEN